jgi:hypothetical protein
MMVQKVKIEGSFEGGEVMLLHIFLDHISCNFQSPQNRAVISPTITCRRILFFSDVLEDLVI